jgi:putative aldouronate transport system permease protein
MKKKTKISNISIKAILTLLSVLCVFPFTTVLLASFTSEEGLLKYGYTFVPKDPSLESYKLIFSNPTQIINAYALTIIVTIIGTILGMIVMTSCAYVMSRDDFKYKKFLSFFVYFTMLFSGGTVASYIWITRYLGMLGSIWALILPIMVSAYNIFILRVACKAVPFSLIESAKLDGASELYIFVRIVIPLTKTGIATIAVLTMFTYWNDWYQSMMFMDNSKDATLQYYLVRILDNVSFAKNNASSSGGLSAMMNVPDEGIQMATCVLAAGPMLCVFPFFQKYFVSGITVGSVKG